MTEIQNRINKLTTYQKLILIDEWSDFQLKLILGADSQLIKYLSNSKNKYFENGSYIIPFYYIHDTLSPFSSYTKSGFRTTFKNIDISETNKNKLNDLTKLVIELTLSNYPPYINSEWSRKMDDNKGLVKKIVDATNPFIEEILIEDEKVKLNEIQETEKNKEIKINELESKLDNFLESFEQKNIFNKEEFKLMIKKDPSVLLNIELSDSDLNSFRKLGYEIVFQTTQITEKLLLNTNLKSDESFSIPTSTMTTKKIIRKTNEADIELDSWDEVKYFIKSFSKGDMLL